MSAAGNFELRVKRSRRMIQWTDRYSKVPIAALLLVAVVSGCSTSKASPATTLSPPITGVRASTTITVATTVPVATTSPSSLPAATTAGVSVEAQVRQGMVEVRAAYWACIRDPWNCRPADFTEPGSPAFADSVAGVDRRVNERRYVGPEDVGYTTITKVEPVDDYQLVTTCAFTTAVDYVKAQEGSGQPDQRLPSASGTVINTWQLVQDKADGRWKLRQRNELSTVKEVNECPPKG
jgi:hypothetical protein